MCRRAGQSLSIKKDRNTQSLLFADLITLDQITVLEDTWSLLWCFPYCIGKVYFLFFFQLQVSVTMKGCITDRKKKTPPALECDDPSFNLESVVESLPSFRKTALVDKLVESWSRHLPHWEPESGTIWRFTRSPILCWGERACAKSSFQSYSACREYHPLLHCWFWIRRNKKKKT